METRNVTPARSNVVDLQEYRQTRSKSFAIAPKASIKLDDGATHVYIALENGRLDYGLIKVNEDNALTLLEPWFYLGTELIRFYAE